MSQYASRIEDLALFRELRDSVGRDGVSAVDVAQLSGMVLQAAEIAGPLLKRIPLTFRQYTEHDIEHCRNLIYLMGKFIPHETKRRLNALELSMLLLCSLLHDLGMYVSDVEKEALVSSEEFQLFVSAHPDRATAMYDARQAGLEFRFQAIRDVLLADYIRRSHSQRATTIVDQNFREHRLILNPAKQV